MPQRGILPECSSAMNLPGSRSGWSVARSTAIRSEAHTHSASRGGTGAPLALRPGATHAVLVPRASTRNSKSSMVRSYRTGTYHPMDACDHSLQHMLGRGHIALGRGARADSLQHMGHGMAASDSHTGSAPYPCSGTWPCAPQRCTCPRRPPRCAPRTSRRAPTSSPRPSAARANHPTPARHAAMRTVATQRWPSGCLHATRPAE